MCRPRAKLITPLAAACLLAEPTLALSHEPQANAEAKRVASRHVERFGISFAPRRWSAACRDRGSAAWSCRVRSNGGQCRGRLRLKELADGTFLRKGTRIACRE
jgi:hypothetical protein